MSDTDLIWKSFEDCVPHLANIEDVRSIIRSHIREHNSIDAFVAQLEHELEESEPTLRTDIRILINEIRHNLRTRRST